MSKGKRQLLGFVLVFGSFFITRVIPGWEPFNWIDLASVPVFALGLVLLGRGIKDV